MLKRDGPQIKLLHSGKNSSTPVLLHSGTAIATENCYTVLQEPLRDPFSGNVRHCVTTGIIQSYNHCVTVSDDTESNVESHCVTTSNPDASINSNHCVTGPENEGVLADKALFRLARRWKIRGISVNDAGLREMFDRWIDSRQGRSLKSSLAFFGDTDRVFGIFQTKWCFVKKSASEDVPERAWRISQTSSDCLQLASIKSDFVRRIGRWMRDLQIIVGVGEVIWLSTPEIVDKLGGNRMAAWRALNKLESLGLISRKDKNKKASPHHSTEYFYTGDLC